MNTLYFVCPYFLASFVHFWIAGGILSGTRAKVATTDDTCINEILYVEHLKTYGHNLALSLKKLLRYIWCYGTSGVIKLFNDTSPKANRKPIPKAA